jgi:hypothetical protein
MSSPPEVAKGDPRANRLHALVKQLFVGRKSKDPQANEDLEVLQREFSWLEPFAHPPVVRYDGDLAGTKVQLRNALSLWIPKTPEELRAKGLPFNAEQLAIVTNALEGNLDRLTEKENKAGAERMAFLEHLPLNFEGTGATSRRSREWAVEYLRTKAVPALVQALLRHGVVQSSDPTPADHAASGARADAVPAKLRKRVARAEKAREGFPVAAAEIGEGARTVNAVQRLTLARRSVVVRAEAAGLTSARLRAAEYLLREAGWAGPVRAWVAADHRCDAGDLRMLVEAAVSPETAEVALAVHGTGGRGTDTSSAVVAMHRSVCDDLGFAVGHTVLIGRSWTDEGIDVHLRARMPQGTESVGVDHELDRAHNEGLLPQRIEELAASPVVALAAVARAIEGRDDRRYDTLVARLLAQASPSTGEAWQLLQVGVDDPAAWTPARDFLTVMVRGQHDPALPLRSLAPDVLCEPVLWDEVLRRGPGPRLYAALVAEPRARLAVDLVEASDASATRGATT